MTAARRPQLGRPPGCLSLLTALCALVVYTLSSGRTGGSSEAARRAALQGAPGPLGGLGPADGAGLVLPTGAARPKYSLTEEQREQAVMSGSQRHGLVAKEGPVPARFWSAEHREWRIAEFMSMVKRDMAQPRSPEFWEADGSGQLALRPLRLPFPLCHTYVNHRYKIILIIHPKSASTATKRYLNLCRLKNTPSCLEPLENITQLGHPLERKWSEYFVLTFVRNPWARAYSSWKFLREGYMLPEGQTPADPAPWKGPAAPCVAAGWRDFCADPLLLGRVCMTQKGCCPGPEQQHFMFYHVTDQATCLLTESGGLAVDFVGRVESVDEDMRAAVRVINSRLPEGVAPLELPAGVVPYNVGPKHQRGESPRSNARYLPAYQGGNASCFSLISRFYEKDVRLMFPEMYRQEQRLGGGQQRQKQEGGAPAQQQQGHERPQQQQQQDQRPQLQQQGDSPITATYRRTAARH